MDLALLYVTKCQKRSDWTALTEIVPFSSPSGTAIVQKTDLWDARKMLKGEEMANVV